MDMDTRPYALAREEGQALWFLGTLVIVKATGEQTGGAFGPLDNVLPAGFAGPYHVHRNEDESFVDYTRANFREDLFHVLG